MLKILMLLLALSPQLRADPSTQPAAGSGQEASEDFRPEDALYAPEEMTYTAAAAETGRATFYSSAKLVALDISHPAVPLEDAELFLDGNYVGKSPLSLEAYLVDKPSLALTARLPGWREASRLALLLPADGDVRIYLAGEGSTSWYTRPAFGIGLAMLAGSIAAYSQNSPSTTALGTGLVAGGVSVIAVTQVIARFFHLPALIARADALNAKAEPAP